MDGKASENELLQASRAGDKEAFGLVVQRYQALVCALTYSATGDVGASEELAQETFIRAWRKLRQLESPGKFRAWLCTIARNLAHSAGRKVSKDVSHAAGSLEAAAALPAAVPGPNDIASEKERREMVWRAVGRIAPRYREPLVLFYRRGQSVSEVAADLDLSEDTVRQRLHRGRQLIKAELSSLVEETLIRSGPGKTFAVAVVAALPAMITPPASAAAVGVAAKGVPPAKTLLATGLTGAILGPILGLLGGVLGAWCSIKNTKSPRERRFMIRMTILVWVLLTLLIGIPLVLMLSDAIPRSAYWVCFTAFFVVLVPLIFCSNAHQRQIQIANGTFQPVESAPRRITRPGIHASYGGSIFGSTAWLLVLTGIVGDWTMFAIIIAADFVILWTATAICRRRPDRYWSTALVAFSALIAGMLIAVNLRWNVWMEAYRQSRAYDPRNDVSLVVINAVVLGLYVVLAVALAWRHVWSKKNSTTAGRSEAD